MNVDEELLREESSDQSLTDDYGDVSGDNYGTQSSQEEANTKSLPTATPEGTPESKSLREAVKADRAKKAKEEKKMMTVPESSDAHKTMSSLLRSAWMNLLSSWGATVLWIDAHVFLRQVLGSSLFCKLGQEWTDKPGIAGKAKVGKKDVKMIETVEPMGLAGLNLGCFIVVLSAGVILSVMLAPLLGTAALLGSIADGTSSFLGGNIFN